MDKQQAQKIIKDTFERSFDMDRFTVFIKNLLNKIDESKVFHAHGYVKEGFRGIIKTYERIGTYNSTDDKKVDIIVVYLQKGFSLDHARVTQRNFAGRYLDDRGEKDAGLFAFVSPDETDWRFSLVKMDYKFEQTKSGKMKVKEEFTPARRWSFLVGANEKSHTAQSRLVNMLANDEHNPTLPEIEKAFDIETVTKEFFKEYRELFLRTKDELDMLVKENPKIKADFEEKGVDTVNFAKKLLGQIVFLYFLQKKGWFGVGRDAEWGTGSKHFLRELFDKKRGDDKNFFNDILEPLFYEALRVGEERKQDDYYYSRFNCKIPFLNGGLFDPIGNYDWVHIDILLPNKLFSNQTKTREGDNGTGILDVFDRYNFTVKEDEPLEKEVAIDPELLGKAYEKFNAIRPDNFEEFEKALKSGKKGDENKFNKQFGVYYTPREIVHYMCQQSLINYLATELSSVIPNEARNLKEDIEALIHTGEQVSENEEIALIKERKINEGKQKSSDYKLKLSENIRKHAELIDDKLSEITVCDPAVGSGAFPVGMMSEIVKARNVLSVFLDDKERTTYDFKRRCIEHSLYGVDIDPGAVEIAKLRLWLSLVVDEEDIKNIKPLPNLDYKIVCGNSLLGVEKNLFNFHLFNELEKLKPLFFNETNPTKKQDYKKQIDDLISEITSGHTEFDFEVYFSEVFHKNGAHSTSSGQGFDVVITNPPYVQIKQIAWDDRKVYQKRFKSAVGRFNLFYFFLELASEIAKQDGFSTFIVPDRLLLNTQCDKLRIWLLKEQQITEIVSFDEAVFEAIVDNIVIIYKNSQESCDNIKVKNKVLLEKLGIFKPKIIPISYFQNSPNSQFDLDFNLNNREIINKIKIKSVCLGDISKIKDGIIQSKISELLFLKKPIDKDSKKLLFGRDITRYRISYNNNWVNYKPDKMMRSELARVKGAPGLRLRKKEIFERTKILTRQTADKIIAAYDTDNFYYSNTLHGTFVTDSNFDPYYVLAILNSKLTNWYYQNTTAEGGKVFAQVKIAILKKLPILKVSAKQQELFVVIVNRIMSITEDEDYPQNPQKQAKVKALEAEIDQLVYKLYDLTPEEIKIVEGGKYK